VLAGILLKVGADIIDWGYLKRILYGPRAGVLIMFTVFIVTVTIDLLFAVDIGMIMASFLFMQRITRMQVDSIDAVQAIEGLTYLADEEADILNQTNDAILLFHLSGSRSFSSAKAASRCHAAARG